jgi:hypothetical protein
MKKGYVINDNTSNTGKPYIDETGKNTQLVENAKWYETEEEAQRVIDNNNWGEWAFVSEEEDGFSE